MSTPLRELFRRLRQRGQVPYGQVPIVTNDPGISGRDTRPSDILTPNPQVMTPANQAVITRPRTMNPPTTPVPANAPPFPATEVPQPPETMAPPEATRQQAVSFNPLTGRPNEAYYRGTGDTAGLYQAYQNWEPHGAKRGFKNALKAGALMASRAIAANPRDPVTAAIAGFGLGAAGATAQPDLKNKLVRDYKLQSTGGELAQQLELQKAQAQVQQAGMVPFQLPDGTWTMVPARQAATLGSRQQGQEATLSLRKQQMDAHIKRWETMGRHEAAQDAQRLYNSGAADDNEDLRDEIANRLGLPPGTRLPAHSQGQIRMDENGNYMLVNPRTGTAKPVTTQGDVQPRTVGSFQQTLEAGRNRRAAAAQQGATVRAQMRGVGGVKPLDTTTRRTIAKGLGDVQKGNDALTQIDEDIKRKNAEPDGPIDPQTGETQKNVDLRNLGRKRQKAVNDLKGIAAELDALDPGNETGVGEGGYAYRKPRAAQPSRAAAPSASSATHAFSIGAYLKRNRGATEADARAFAQQNYPDYDVVP